MTHVGALSIEKIKFIFDLHTPKPLQSASYIIEKAKKQCFARLATTAADQFLTHHPFNFFTMAEIQSQNGSGPTPRGKPRSKKTSTRIDFTPMVDLGFLLITFFMLTTSLTKPQIMALVMPEADSVDREPVKQSKVLTLLLGADDKVYWYEGLEEAKLDSTHYGSAGLRAVILDKMKRVETQWGLQDYLDYKTQEPRQGSHLTVIIKATQAANYKNLVDVLDEMAITHVRYYVIVDLSKSEEAFLRNPAGGLKV